MPDDDDRRTRSTNDRGQRVVEVPMSLLGRHKEMLRCDLDEGEVAVKAATAAMKNGEVQRLAEQRKEIADRMKAQIQELDGEVRDLLRQIREGQEEREVECETRLDPAGLAAVIIRTDTGEEIRTRELSQDERQAHLFRMLPGVGEDEEPPRPA